MAPDVVLIADGGGLVRRRLDPDPRGRTGGEAARAREPGGPTFETTTVWLNGAPAGRIDVDGELSRG